MTTGKGARAMRTLLMAAMAATGLLILTMGSVSDRANAQSSVRPPPGATLPAGSNPAPSLPSVRRPGSDIPAAANPGDSRGNIFDNDMWSNVRKGERGIVSIPDKKAGQLVQSAGWDWMRERNGPRPTYLAWAMGGMVALLALFFLVRGRIRISSGFSGRTITRFGTVERMGHWLLAVSFIILALSGLNVMYGKAVLLPLVGKGTFASIAASGKLLHNYVAFAFMAGLLLTFVMWVFHNFPNRYDIVWLFKGGGMFSKHSHPPAKKFNAGQKILFWLVMLGGLSISLSGISMMLPGQTAMFSKTFGLLNIFGLGLPTVLSPIQEMQFATTWHGIVAIVLTCVIIAHIYIGTMGMEGAFDAMGSGEVDVNWAKEHHSIWADEVLNEQGSSANRGPSGHAQPAE